MVEDELLSFLWHHKRLADRGEMVFAVCGMATIEKVFGET